MFRFSTPVSHGRLYPSGEIQRRLDIQAKLSARLLAQVADAYMNYDYSRSALASDAYDEAQDKIASLQQEMTISQRAEALVNRLAEADEQIGRVLVASVSYGPVIQCIRRGQLAVASCRE